MTDKIILCIKDYYEKRGLKWPTSDDAMKFVQTEIAEVYELMLARTGGYIRNHPENKPDYSGERMAEELGDAIMMLLVTGIQEGVNPIEAMLKKIGGKVGEDYLRFTERREE